MTDRNPRRLTLTVVITILVVAAVALAFYLGRSTSTPPTSTPIRTTTTPVTPTRRMCPPTERLAGARPTAGPAVAGEGGSKAGPAGLPLGYSHAETGAVNAATNYLMWMNSLKITDKAAADAMAGHRPPTTRLARRLIDSFDGVRSGHDDITADSPSRPVEPMRSPTTARTQR